MLKFNGVDRGAPNEIRKLQLFKRT